MSIKKIGTAQIDMRANTGTLRSDLSDAEQLVSKSSRQMASEMRAQTTEARHAVHLLADDIGITIPRALQNVIAKSSSLAPIFATAFSAVAIIGFAKIISEVPEALTRSYEGIVNMSLAMGGFTAKSQEAFEAIKKLNLELFTKPDSLGAARQNLAQVNAQISALEKSRSSIQQTNNVGSLFGLGGGAAFIAKEIGARREQNAITDQLTDKEKGLYQQRISLLEQIKKLEDDASTERDKGEKQFQQQFVAAQALIKEAIDKVGGEDFVTKAAQPWQAIIDKLREAKPATAAQAQEIQKLIPLMTQWRDLAADRAWQNFNDQLEKIGLQSATKGLGESVRAMIQAITGPTEEAKKAIAQVGADIAAALEAERAQEQAITTEAQVGYTSRIELAKNLGELRAKESAELGPLVEKYKQLAATIGDPKLIENAKKFGAELDNITAKSTGMLLQFGNAIDGMKVFFKTFVNDSESNAKRVYDAFTRAFSGLEDELARFVTRQKTSFAELAQSIAADFVKMGIHDLLKKAVSKVADIFGINLGTGKPDGTQGNPYHTIVDNLSELSTAGLPGVDITGGFGGDFSWLSGLFSGGGGGALPGVDISGGFGSDFSWIPGLATGGPVDAGRLYRVNENGTELFRPNVNGKIIPMGDAQQGGQPVVVNFVVNTPDADSFRKSQHQMVNDAMDAAARAQRRR